MGFLSLEHLVFLSVIMKVVETGSFLSSSSVGV